MRRIAAAAFLLAVFSGACVADRPEGSPSVTTFARETPLQGSNVFPDEWRVAVDDLSMLDLPRVDRVAEALRADPGLASRVPAVVSMAGAIDVAGNTPGGVAEYNV